MCVASVARVIVLPFRSGTRVPAGRYFATASSRETSPRATMSARSVAVKGFVTEPISKRACSSSGTPFPEKPAATNRRVPSASRRPTTTPTPPPRARRSSSRRRTSSFPGKTPWPRADGARRSAPSNPATAARIRDAWLMSTPPGVGIRTSHSAGSRRLGLLTGRVQAGLAGHRAPPPSGRPPARQARRPAEVGAPRRQSSSPRRLSPLPPSRRSPWIVSSSSPEGWQRRQRSRSVIPSSRCFA